MLSDFLNWFSRLYPASRPSRADASLAPTAPAVQSEPASREPVRDPGSLPLGYRLVDEGGADVFDPALKHYGCAFRRSIKRRAKAM